MFIQVIHGTCTRQDELRSVGESWREELGDGATGWLGGTFGFTEDNDFFAIVRFESREAAMANSQRPEQGEWAARLAELLEGAPAFYDCDDVSSFLEGGSDDAGFVQVIRGQTDDATPIKAMLADPGDLKDDAAGDHRRHLRVGVGRDLLRDGLLHRRGERPQGRGDGASD